MNLNFNAIGFFHGLFEMRLEDIDLFLSFFPGFPEILECTRKAANEEKRRRSFEVQIENMMKEKGKKLKRELEEEEELKKRKHMKMLTGVTGSGEGTSKTMN